MTILTVQRTFVCFGSPLHPQELELPKNFHHFNDHFNVIFKHILHKMIGEILELGLLLSKNLLFSHVKQNTLIKSIRQHKEYLNNAGQ